MMHIHLYNMFHFKLKFKAMRNIYIQFMVMVVIVFSALAVTAQTRIVKVDGWAPPYEGGAETFNNVLYQAIHADSTERKSNPNVIYELKRGHKYPQGEVIKNSGYHLHIRAEDGIGDLPEFIPGKGKEGTYGADYINAFHDLTLENLAFRGYRPDGAYLNNMVEAMGNHSRYIIRGCTFDGDRGAGIVIRADSMKVYVSDVVVTNCGHRKAVGGGGRFLDMRPGARTVDTLIIKNSTFSNGSDRIIRNMGSEVNYLEIDHFTALNNAGYHGAIQLGHVRTARVTNSLFANTISLGHSDSRTSEQTQPEKHLSVISLDTVFDGQVIEVRNNNIYNDQVLLDVWDKYASVISPWAITPTIEGAIGPEDSEHAYFEEPLIFEQTCSPVSAFIDAYYANPSAPELPDNWCVGGDGGYFPDQVDLSYSNSSFSYTAADHHYPVGNLNYFPGLKTKWEAGIMLVYDTTVVIVYDTVAVTDTLIIDVTFTGNGSAVFTNTIRVYPNPTKDVVFIHTGDHYGSLSDYFVKIVNALGEQVFESAFTEQIFEINLSLFGQTGLYFIQVIDQTNQVIDIRKIILE
jgi:hypothetical protein